MRRKANGSAFEREFKQAVGREFFVRRLPTLNTGYAGQTQPADFYVIGSRFNYVELKETTYDRFSLSAIEQLPEIKEYVKFRKGSKLPAVVASRYWLIVHFLADKKLVAIEAENVLDMIELHKTVRPDGTTGQAYDSLSQLIGGVQF